MFDNDGVFFFFPVNLCLRGVLSEDVQEDSLILTSQARDAGFEQRPGL